MSDDTDPMGSPDATVSVQPASGQRILIVEDDEMVQLLAQKAVEGDGREVRVTETVEAARSALSEEDFDAVILDLFLPDGDGRQLLAEIRERPRSAHLHVLVLSGATGRNTKLECFRLGADEFLEKPMDPELLGAAVDRQLQRARTRARESRVDSLTGLPNRAALVERFSELAAVSARSGSPLTLALIEMEGLEDLRNRTGREKSDEIEAGFAAVLSEVVEEPDVVGRWGDATFVVLFPDTGVRDSEPALSRVLAEARSRGYTRSSDTPLPVRVGVVDGRRQDDLRSAVQDAEQALALAHGRDDRKDRSNAGDPESPEGPDSPDGPAGPRSPEHLEDPGGIAIHPVDAEGEIEDKRRILLIEDAPVLAKLMEHRLRRGGMNVDHLASGSEVRRLVEKEDSPTYDVILCDVKLPGADGFELLQRFKEDPKWASIPVVMVTSMGREADVVRAFDLGADDYVLKPVSPGELIARIHRLLRRS